MMRVVMYSGACGIFATVAALLLYGLYAFCYWLDMPDWFTYLLIGAVLARAIVRG
jgi:hypothetical protein